MTDREDAGRLRGGADLDLPGLRLAGREAGAGAQRLLEREVRGHVQRLLDVLVSGEFRRELSALAYDARQAGERVAEVRAA
ncbi:hypothetical protein WME95_06765 [Sorangium sp. So ce327]|jgi:hypothetical protein|uniref:hypothetical protein n=1 Tax=Sorangium sp. So ce327 TaxID=3133301 RepID=UPI003F637F29